MCCNPCCCIPIRMGVAAVANFGTVLSVAKLVLMLIAFASRLGVRTAERQNIFKGTNHPFSIFTELEKASEKQDVSTINAIMSVEVGLNLLNIIFSSLLLLHGVKKNSLWVVQAYLAFTILFVGLSAVLTNTNGFLEIIPVEVYTYEVISHLIYLYFIYVVYYAYLEINDICVNNGVVEVILYDARETAPSFENDEDPTDTRAI